MTIFIQILFIKFATLQTYDLLSENSKNFPIFQWVKIHWLPHIQEPITDAWKPAGYLYSHMYMQTHTYENSSWVEQGKGCAIFNMLDFLNQCSCNA